MEYKWRSFVRPVLALLIVGIIIGLIYIYYRVDDVEIDADSGGDVEEHLENEGGEVIVPPIENIEPPIEEIVPPEVEAPRYPIHAEDGVLRLDMSHTLLGTYPVRDGYILIGEGEDGTIITRIRDEACVGERVIVGKCMVHEMGTYGVAVVAIREGHAIATVMDMDCAILDEYDMGRASEVRVLSSDSLDMLVRRDEEYSVLSLDKGAIYSILDIDIDADIMSIYPRSNAEHYIVWRDGSVGVLGASKYTRIMSLGYEISDIEPVMIEGALCYAVIERAETPRLHILDKLWNETLVTACLEGEIFYSDRLYVLDASHGRLARYCTCGEYIDSVPCEIARISYIDYDGGRVYAKMRGGRYASLMMDDADSLVWYDGAVRYVDETVCIMDGEHLVIDILKKTAI